MSWESQGACVTRKVDPELFYPKSLVTDRAQVRAARWVCERRCPVTAQCLADALAKEGRKSAKERSGIRGALTPGERAALSEQNRLAEAA